MSSALKKGVETIRIILFFLMLAIKYVKVVQNAL
jgi:hypothetical protein